MTADQRRGRALGVTVWVTLGSLAPVGCGSDAPDRATVETESTAAHSPSDEEKTSDPAPTGPRPETSGTGTTEDAPGAGGTGPVLTTPVPSGAGGSSATGGASAAGGAPTDAGSGGSMAGAPSGEPSLDPSAGGATSQPGEVIALPDGSREYEHIVNLINPDAVQQVESLLRGGDETGLALATQQFYQYYLDEYEFLFILTDHEVSDAIAAASFKPVYRPAQAATGDTLFIDRSLEHGSERLLGVIAGQGDSSPPLEHEILHYWAAHLDPSLGFGRDRDTTYQSHWGLTSVHGQLGGFDGESLECTRPVGALPPNCEAESDGRFIYAVDRFAPHVNRAVDYAPLELYLMGLLAADEVPERYWVFEDTSWTDTTVDDVTDKYLIQAGGLAEIEFADVLALHGEVPLRAEGERAFRAAFVVVSEAPASDEVMAQVSQWQEIFGNHAEPSGGLSSFEARTGGRATLTTRLGPRRTTSDPLPMPEPPLQCSVTMQDCAEGLACYGSNTPFCGVPGVLAEGDACEVNADCLPGLGCPNRLAACAPYCDPFDVSAPLACATLCAAGSVNLVDEEGTLTGGYCLP